MKTLNKQKGYIALISAILISVSLLTLVIAVSFEGFYSRFNVLESEQKEMSAYLAESCFNTAIIKLSQDDDYAGNENILIDEVNEISCHIGQISSAGPFGEDFEIEAQGINGNAYTNLVVVVDLTPAPTSDIISWKEVASF